MQYQRELTLTTKKLPEYRQSINSILQDKKKTMMIVENSLKTQIKEHFSQVTSLLMDRENILLQQLTSNILKIFEQIQYYLSMSQPQRKFNHIGVSQLLNKQLKVNFCRIDNMQKFINKNFQIEVINKANKIQQQGLDDQQLIEKLQLKIEKMMIKEEKQAKRIEELQIKYHLKEDSKIKQQPYSSFKLQRLQSQNNILQEVNQSCSKKIIQITQENLELKRLLDKGYHHSSTVEYSLSENQYMTISKQQLQNSQHIELEHQLTELKQKIKQNQTQIQNITHQKNAQTSYILQLKQINGKLVQQVNFLNENNQKIYRDYELSCKKKLELQQENKQSKRIIQTLQQVNQNLKLQLNSQIQENISIKAEIKIHINMVNKLNEQIQVMKQRQINTFKDNSDKIDKYLKICNEKEQQLKKIKEKLAENQKNLMKKSKDIQELNEYIEKNRDEKQNKINQMQQQIKNTEKKQKSTHRKEINKTVKNLQKEHELEKKQIYEDFNLKNTVLNRQIQDLSLKLKQLNEISDQKAKIVQNRIKLMKERFVRDLQQMTEKGKGKITVEIIQKYIQSTSTLILRSTQIKQLKQQIATLKKCRPVQVKNMIVDEKLLEVQVYELKKSILKSQKQLELGILHEKITDLEIQLDRKDKQMGKILEKQKQQCVNLKQQISILKKVIKNRENQETEKQQKNKTINKQESQSEMARLKNSVNEMQSQIRQIKNELQKKRELIIQQKKNFKDKQQELKIVKSQLQTQIAESEKWKKYSKQITLKQQLIKDMKEKLQSLKYLEKQNENLKKNIEQKSKQFKYQLNKKDQIIKLLKQENEQEEKQEKITVNSQQLESLKDLIRKGKAQIDRKDQLIKFNKQKFERQNMQIESKLVKSENQIKKLKYEIDLSDKKLESYKIQSKKQQSIKTILLSALRKIYEKLLLKNKCLSMKQCSPNKYAQGLSILQLTMQDLNLEEPQSYRNTSKDIKQVSCDLDEILLSQDVKLQSIIAKFQKVIQKKS